MNKIDNLRFLRAYEEYPTLFLDFSDSPRGYVSDSRTSQRLLDKLVSGFVILDRESREDKEDLEEFLNKSVVNGRYVVFVRD